MDFLNWKSQWFGKSLVFFGLLIFFLQFLKSLGWYGFSYGFLVILNLFINVCSKLLLFLDLTNAVLSKTTFGGKFVSQKNGVLCAKEIHRLGPMD